MIENLDSLPALCASVRSIAGGKPFVVGPSAIGMRMNPYGDTPPRNLANTRQPMNENDPRQRGLMGAAWALSYVCHMARGGAQAVTLGGVTGAQGVIAVQQPWTQPYFDQAGGYFPIFHVLRALAGLAECERLETSATLPATIDALIFRTQDAVLALVANLQPRPVTISLPADLTGQRVLDAAHFHIAAQDPAFLDTHAPASGAYLTLTAYAVAAVRRLRARGKQATARRGPEKASTIWLPASISGSSITRSSKALDRLSMFLPKLSWRPNRLTASTPTSPSTPAIAVELDAVAHRPLGLGVVQVHHQHRAAPGVQRIGHPGAGVGMLDLQPVLAGQAEEHVAGGGDGRVPFHRQQRAARVLGAEARQRAGAQAQHADGLFLGGSRNSSQAIIWPVYSSTSSAGFLTRMAPCTHSVLKWR